MARPCAPAGLPQGTSPGAPTPRCHAHRVTARRAVRVLIGAAGALLATVAASDPWLVWSWNFSTSLPGSLFVTVRDRLPAPGELVTYRWPGGFGYPAGSLFHKQVAGRAGDAIAWEGHEVRVAGVAIGAARARTRDARPLAPLPAGAIAPGEYFVHTAHPDSFDSRYAAHGLVRRAQVVGTAWRVF